MGTLCLAFAFALSWATSTVEARDWWVDASNPNCPGSGTPEDPFCKIQDAIDAAASGDLVWIRPGTYQESLVVANIRIGLLATASAQDTILIPSLALPSLMRVERSSDVLLRGLSLLDGFAQSEGGAISCADSRLRAEDCRFAGCEARWGPGGAIAASDSDIALTRCGFHGNSSMGTVNWGGAVYVSGGRLDVEDCTFSQNSAWYSRFPGSGGAIHARSAECQIRGSSFAENESTLGCGLYFENCQAELFDCEVIGNRIAVPRGLGKGAGIYSTAGSLVIRSSRICSNSVSDYDFGSGGGVTGATLIESSVICHNLVFVQGIGAAPIGIASGGGASGAQRIVGCLFNGNRCIAIGAVTATASGGGATAQEIIASTFVNNVVSAEVTWEIGTAEASAAGASAQRIESSVFWSNSPDELKAEDVRFSDVMGSQPGPGNIDEDPRFLSQDDFRLSCKSPCIDSGQVEEQILLPLLDASGQNYRVIGRGIDMGAYEAGIHWIPRLQHKGPRQLAFECQSPVIDPAVLASIFIGLEQFPGGVVVPDGTGRTLDLSPDLAFRLWLELPTKHRTVSLSGCEGASTVPLVIPRNLPAGLAIYFGGLALDQKTGTILSVSDVERMELD